MENAGPSNLAKEQEEAKISQTSIESCPEATNTSSSGPVGTLVASQQANPPKSLKDAVKPRYKKKKNASSPSDLS